MDYNTLKKNIFEIQQNYFNKQDKVLDFWHELQSAFYEYADSNNNTDYEFQKYFQYLIPGIDCIGLVSGATEDELYSWKRDCVESVDFDMLVRLSNLALTEYLKKEAGFEL